MQDNDDLKQRAGQRFIILVAFLALITGAGITMIGVLIGAHVSLFGQQNIFSFYPQQPAGPAYVQQPNGPGANAAGSQTCTPGPQVFSYTGSPQAIPVPEGCSAAIIEAVGAGGGGFVSGQQTGGNGGFASAQIKLSGISNLIVVVGQGGSGTCTGDCSGDNVRTAFGGGGGTHEGNGGGGYSGVFNGSLDQSTALVIAGGGGGGGGGAGGTGGDGGGPAGTLGSNPASGGGGTQTSGGQAAGEDDGYSGDMPGGPLAGGTGAYGGGGGGGYFGGGGGGRQGYWIHAGGGGGSGYVSPSAIGPVLNISGSAIGLSKDDDAARKAGLGVGGLNGDGGNGSVTIIWIRERTGFSLF